MARMYPNRLDPDTQSMAERLLYAAFRDRLDDSYTVFHSVAWQALDEQRRPRDGEADFVIAHPERGILVLEVKGGHIHYDPERREWTSISAGKIAHPIKDPFLQATTSRHTLREQVKKLVPHAGYDLTIGHAVAFPDTVLPPDGLGLGRSRPIMLDSTDLADLPGWVERVLAYYRGATASRDAAPGKAAVAALRMLLGKTLDIRPVLWGEFVREREELVHLTQEQYHILDALNRHRRAAISGPAGSGKTMLAVEKATRLASQGFRVLLTCFNKGLATDLTARIPPRPNLEIRHFHGLCGALAREAGIALAPAHNREYFEQTLPDALLQAADRLGPRYDAIVVDEGQDFQDTWWIPLQMLLQDPDQGILYIFYDDNQRLYSQDRQLPVPDPPYTLTANCRNTQTIHRLLLKFYRGEQDSSVQGPPGRPVKILEYDGPEALGTTLGALLDKLTGEEGIPSNEIVVLTPLSADKSRLGPSPPAGRIRLTDSWPPDQDQVYSTTVHAFKGLERGVVVLTELERWPEGIGDRAALLYVACSRACNHLVVLLPMHASPEVRKWFA